MESLRQCPDPTDLGSVFAGSICCICQQNHWLEPDGHEIPAATLNSALLRAPAEQRRAVPKGPGAWSSCFPQSSLDLEVKLSWGAVRVAVSNSPYLQHSNPVLQQESSASSFPREKSASPLLKAAIALSVLCVLRLLFLKVPS